jgi:hypothetical protein
VSRLLYRSGKKPSTHWVGPRASLDDFEKRNVYSHLRVKEFCIAQTIACLLYRLSHRRLVTVLYERGRSRHLNCQYVPEFIDCSTRCWITVKESIWKHSIPGLNTLNCFEVQGQNYCRGMAWGRAGKAFLSPLLTYLVRFSVIL